MASTDFTTALEEARQRGRVLLDLAESDPGRCGLGWDAAELAAMRERRSALAAPASAQEAREAVAGYLAGHGASLAPERVVLVPSIEQARRILLDVFRERGGEVLVPGPDRLSIEAATTPGLRPYRLSFEGRWRLDRRSIRKAVSSRTRAILVGNPADPTGAELSRDELEFLEELCAERGLALVGDEACLDSTLEPSTSVATVRRCLAVHVSGLGGVCGLPGLHGEWMAVAGPDAVAAPLASRLASLAEGVEDGALLVPPLLGRREAFLGSLRRRLARNRSGLAAASVREAPWALQWGGGWWATLQINPAQDAEGLCLALLDEGVAVLPGQVGGFPRQGYVVVSLLPTPAIFDAALVRLDASLRRPGHPLS